jgi:thiamine-phosphate pyrophosphorylase
MASRCQLYLSIRAGFAGALPVVEEVLAAAQVPSLLVIGEGEPDRLVAIIAAAHRQNVAVITDNAAQMERVPGFDGLHLSSGGPPVKAVRSGLGPDRVIGVDCRLSRHEAMIFGETGADYVAFGRGLDAAEIDELADIVGWWSDLFEIPCAAFLPADAPETSWRRLVLAGADFIVPGPEIWDEAGAVRERIERMASCCGIQGADAS